MNLKKAREKGELDKFIKEHENVGNRFFPDHDMQTIHQCACLNPAQRFV